MFRIVCVFLLLGTLAYWTEPAAAQNRLVELEIVSTGGQLGAEQQVMQMLTGVGADRISVRSARNRARPSIDESESGGVVSVRVVGVLDGTKIRLPGKSFSTRDAAGIRDFIQQLRDDGADVAMADKKAFGLTSEQLVTVYEVLSAEVTIATQGQPSNEVVNRLVEGLRNDVIVSRQARAALDTTAILEDYQGLSTGTALAGILRPLGLVLTPHRPQGQALQFQIAMSDEVEEHWPVGWPVETPPIDAAPALFEKLDDVAINPVCTQRRFGRDSRPSRDPVPLRPKLVGASRYRFERTESNFSPQTDDVLHGDPKIGFSEQTEPEPRAPQRRKR